LEYEIEVKNKGLQKMSLIESVKDNNLQQVKTLILGGVDVNAVDVYGRAALSWAVNEGHIECATALLNAKADVDNADNYGDTPLHRAFSSGSAKCVRVLINHKANVNTLNKYGCSPLHYAYMSLACVQVCLPPLCILVNLLLICALDTRHSWHFV
jgi:ankyrin repeat protein